MLTDPKLRSQVDALWDKFWTGGLANPLDAIEQFSYLPYTVPKVLKSSRRFERRVESRRKRTCGTVVDLRDVFALAGNHAVSQ